MYRSTETFPWSIRTVGLTSLYFPRDGLIHYRSTFIPVKDLPRTLVWVGAIEFYVANSDWRSKKSWLFLWGLLCHSWHNRLITRTLGRIPSHGDKSSGDGRLLDCQTKGLCIIIWGKSIPINRRKLGQSLIYQKQLRSRTCDISCKLPSRS